MNLEGIFFRLSFDASKGTATVGDYDFKVNFVPSLNKIEDLNFLIQARDFIENKMTEIKDDKQWRKGD